MEQNRTELPTGTREVCHQARIGVYANYRANYREFG
jgi:hypothetical protein